MGSVASDGLVKPNGTIEVGMTNLSIEGVPVRIHFWYIWSEVVYTIGLS